MRPIIYEKTELKVAYLFPVAHLDLPIQRCIADGGKCPSSGKLLKLSSANASAHLELSRSLPKGMGFSKVEELRTTRRLGACKDEKISYCTLMLKNTVLATTEQQAHVL